MLKTPSERMDIKCTWCGSDNYRKIGIRRLVNRLRQVCFCKNCNRKFTAGDLPFEGQVIAPIIPPEEKKYGQNWKAYNAAQTSEKKMFLQILSELLGQLESEPNKKGRPRKEISDVLFAACLKVFTGFSGRRLHSDLEFSHAQGYLQEVPHFNTVLKTFNRKDITDDLAKIMRLAAFPLREVESKFSIDSTGFSTSMFARWKDRRSGKDTTHRVWAKCHAMVGTKTNIITSVEITQGYSADSPHFIPLLEASAQSFAIKEVTADRAYSSKANLEAAVNMNVVPIIPFKNNTNGKNKGSQIWGAAYRYFINNQEEFYKRYSVRSNIEATFSMIKRKFGNNVRTKTFIGHTNEILCKAICHNISCLIMELHEMGIDPAKIWGTNPAMEMAKQMLEDLEKQKQHGEQASR